MDLQKEYQKFIESIRKGEIEEREPMSISRPDPSLDYVDVSLGGTEDYIMISPNDSRRENYIEQVLQEASNDRIITPENILKKVLPAFSKWIPKTLEERANSSYKLKTNFFSQEEQDFSFPEVVLSMMAIEEGRNLILDYSWGR
jgi:hypothetical protein